MILWIVSFVGLAAFVAALARAFFGVPARRALAGGSRVSAVGPASTDGLRAVLVKLTPSPEQVVAHTPTLPPAPLVRPASELPAQPGAIDLSIVGVADDREAIDRELWQQAKRALPQRRAKS